MAVHFGWARSTSIYMSTDGLISIYDELRCDYCYAGAAPRGGGGGGRRANTPHDFFFFFCLSAQRAVRCPWNDNRAPLSLSWILGIKFSGRIRGAKCVEVPPPPPKRGHAYLTQFRTYGTFAAGTGSYAVVIPPPQAIHTEITARVGVCCVWRVPPLAPAHQGPNYIQPHPIPQHVLLEVTTNIG